MMIWFSCSSGWNPCHSVSAPMPHSTASRAGKSGASWTLADFPCATRPATCCTTGFIADPSGAITSATELRYEWFTNHAASARTVMSPSASAASAPVMCMT